jgi:hypothetical protein
VTHWVLTVSLICTVNDHENVSQRSKVLKVSSIHAGVTFIEEGVFHHQTSDSISMLQEYCDAGIVKTASNASAVEELS